jgi:hypothetical protein
MSDKPNKPYLNHPDAPSQPGDDQEGGWSREQRMAMDARFCRRVELALGQEARLETARRTVSAAITGIA